MQNLGVSFALKPWSYLNILPINYPYPVLRILSAIYFKIQKMFAYQVDIFGTMFWISKITAVICTDNLY